MSELKELLNCPFCGSIARMHRLSGIGGFCAHCSDEDCFIGPELKGYHSEDEAVRQWNTRAHSDVTAQLTPPRMRGSYYGTLKWL